MEKVEDYDRRIQKALDLKNDGKNEPAKQELLEIIDKYPKKNAPYGLLATVYYNEKKYDCSEKYFRIASKNKPDNRVLSLGLFHSLWSQEKEEEAIEELKRFMKVGHCDDYVEIAESFNIDLSK